MKLSKSHSTAQTICFYMKCDKPLHEFWSIGGKFIQTSPFEVLCFGFPEYIWRSLSSSPGTASYRAPAYVLLHLIFTHSQEASGVLMSSMSVNKVKWRQVKELLSVTQPVLAEQGVEFKPFFFACTVRLLRSLQIVSFFSLVIRMPAFPGVCFVSPPLRSVRVCCLILRVLCSEARSD